MRELKFRIWGDGAFGGPSYIYDFSWTSKGKPISYFKPKEWQIEQYTGLKDKNGREIYEGDILKYEFSDILCSVKWSKEDNDCHPCFVMNDLSSQRGEVEIVGNIHENPELLN